MTWATRSACTAILIWLAASSQLGWAGSKDKPIVIDDQLGAKDPRDAKRKDSPAKLHKVKLRQGVVYVIELVSKDFDAYLRIEDAAGKQLAENDDTKGGTNSAPLLHPAHRVNTGSSRPVTLPKTGRYRLTVQEAPAAHPKPGRSTTVRPPSTTR